MHRSERWLVAATLLALVGPAAAQQPARSGGEVVGHSIAVSDDGSVVHLDLADGGRLTIQFADGVVRIDGNTVGRYTAEQERAWRELLGQGGRLDSNELLRALADRSAEVKAAAVAGSIEAALAAQLGALQTTLEESGIALTADLGTELDNQLAGLRDLQNDLGPDVVIDLRALTDRASVAAQFDGFEQQLDRVGKLGFKTDDARIHVGDLTVRRGTTVENDLVILGGDVSVFGRVQGNLVAVDGDVVMHGGGVVTGDVVTVNGSVIRGGGRVLGDVRTTVAAGSTIRPDRKINLSAPMSEPVRFASLLGMFVALGCMGFGFTFFMPRQLELVSSTVVGSFGKSVLAGTFAQPLLPPVFAMLIVGLAITVVGILVIPFAIVGSLLFLVAAATGGYLAVAKAVGDAYLTRRMAQGHAVVRSPYRSLLYGLVGLMTIWLPAAMLGGVPFVGAALTFLAVIFSWVVATAGFGAAILSRAGLRATFADHHRPALTDEFYWPEVGEAQRAMGTGRSPSSP